MSSLKKLLIFIIIPFMVTVLVALISKNSVYASSNFNKDTPVKIAVFLDNANAMYVSFVKQNFERIQKENEDKVNFTFFDAKDNQNTQNESIDTVLKENYDLFIVSIISSNLKDVQESLRKIMDKNIPLILNPDPAQEIIDYVKSYKRFVVIGGDYIQSGAIQGKILAKEWNSNKKSIDKNNDNILQYVILKGRFGSPLTHLRSRYVISALNDAGIKTEELAAPYCEWMAECAKSAIESLFLKHGNKIEAIIANNDDMALGAIEALQKLGYNKGNKAATIPVVGIDGMPAAKDFIQKGYMTGTAVVEPRDLTQALYSIGMNLAAGRNSLENTKYKFDDTGFTVHLNYKEYTK